MLRAEAPLVASLGGYRLTRAAPVVSYGEQAGLFLITMRAAADRPPTDVRLVLVSRSDVDDGDAMGDAGASIAVTGDWNAMGLRGTRSVPMTFDVHVGADRIVGESFRKVALMTLVPAAHVGWTAAWLGAARGALRRFVAHSRQHRRPGMQSDLFLTRLADVRLALDLTDALLTQVVVRLDELRNDSAPFASYEEATHNILINNLKVAGSRLCFRAADGLIELGGMNIGYREDDDVGLARLFRDLRSASLMYNNDRLLKANGRVILVEGSSMPQVWTDHE